MKNFEQRMAEVIGQLIVENAKLGMMVEHWQAEAEKEKSRADEAELRLKEKAVE